MPVVIGRITAQVLVILAIVCLCLPLVVSKVSAVDVPLDPIAEIIFDDEGKRLNYPMAVTYDPVMDEIYLVNAIAGRVVVYGPDFFPRTSIGIGRGVVAPSGLTVMENGEVYVCQIRNFKNPSMRITILNAAFFVDREIFIDQIPQAVSFRIKQTAVSRDGLIYVAGDSERGVLVLDEEGNFLRMLQPMEDISLLSRFSSPGSPSNDAETEVDATVSSDIDSGETGTEEDDLYADIPEEFRPQRKRDEKSLGIVDGRGPAKINFVAIDRSGRIYLLSAETGKVYVHGSDESPLFSFGTAGGSPGQLSQPRALAIDENRKLIYVVDYMRHTVLTYNMEGEFLFEWGGRGTSPGWFNFPTAIAVNSLGQALVADLFNRRVQVLEVGYEDVLPYLEKLTDQDGQPVLEDSESETSAETNLPDNMEGAESESETVPELEKEIADDPRSFPETESEPIKKSAPVVEPESVRQPSSAVEPLDIIIEEVIIGEQEPASFSEVPSEPEDPSDSSAPGTND